jgi:peptide/nickel transport system substrate-binding protein
MRRTMHVLVLAGFAICSATACATAQGSIKAPKRGGILNFAVVAEPPTYDCHATTTFGVLHPVAPHYSTLIKYDGDWKDMRIVPDAAESWSSTPDGLSFTFKLRRNV